LSGIVNGGLFSFGVVIKIRDGLGMRDDRELGEDGEKKKEEQRRRRRRRRRRELEKLEGFIP
jgi:hypothetical protein